MTALRVRRDPLPTILPLNTRPAPRLAASRMAPSFVECCETRQLRHTAAGSTALGAPSPVNSVASNSATPEPSVVSVPVTRNGSTTMTCGSGAEAADRPKPPSSAVVSPPATASAAAATMTALLRRGRADFELLSATASSAAVAYRSSGSGSTERRTTCASESDTTGSMRMAGRSQAHRCRCARRDSSRPSPVPDSCKPACPPPCPIR